MLDPGLKDLGPDGFPRPVVLTQERQVKRLTAADFPDEAVVVDSVRVPRTFNPRNAQSRRDLAAIAAPRGTGGHGQGPSAQGPVAGRRRPAAARPAPADAPAPLPRLRRARGARPLGRALRATAARHRRDRAQGLRPYQHHRPHLRPGLHGARPARLPRGRHGDARPATSWPGSTARATCSSSSACARGCGTT